MLEKLFKLKENQTSVKTEIIAGLTTFLTMAYIIFVNPSILSQTGMDQGAVFVATCLAAAVGCFIMGLYANYPVAQAPGMGLNAFFTYTVVMQMGYTWEVALGAVFVSGVCFILLSIFKIRAWIINSIPISLRSGISAGIGLFLALIALKGCGIVVGNAATIISLGDITTFQAVMGALGFFFIVALTHHKIKGAVVISILAVTVIGLVCGQIKYTGFVSMPPSIAPTFLALDLSGVFTLRMTSVILAFLFVDLFDTAGTLMAVATESGMVDKNGRIPRMGRALIADSTATAVGALFGTSNTTSYVESTAGVAEGGRTGLTAVTVGVLFLLALFFAPLAGMVPAYATAGALLYVAILMISGLAKVDWKDLTEAAPVMVVSLMMPFTYSIANGIALGFISYAVIKLLSGRAKEVNIGVWIIALIFLAKFIFLG